MKRRAQLIYLIILPLLLFFLAIVLKNTKGEFFLWYNNDGPYAILLSSLNIAQLKSPGFFQGTAIVPQLITAAVIKLTHLFQGIDSNIAVDVFKRPEFYLSQIHLVFTFLTVITLFFFGVISYLSIKNIYGAIFLQLTPFITYWSVFQLSQNTTETTLMILILALLAVSIFFLNENAVTSKKNLIYVFFYGVICGLALATKISVIPVMIIPFLLMKEIKFKFLYLVISFAVFSILLFFFCPEILNFFISIFDNLFSHNKYSAGHSNWMEIDELREISGQIFRKYFPFGLIHILITGILILQFLPKFKYRIRANKYFLMLVGIFIINSAFLLIVLKTHVGRYLLPSLLFCVFGLFALSSVISDLFPKYFRKNKYLYLFVFFIITIIPQINTFVSSLSTISLRRDESYKIVNYLEDNFRNSTVITSNYVSSIPICFFVGLHSASLPYDSLLMQIYAKDIYYNNKVKDFVYHKYDIELKNKLTKSDTIIYHTYKGPSLEDFMDKIKDFTKKQNSTAEEIFSNKNGEVIYLVTLKD